MDVSKVEYLTVKAACEHLGVSPNTLRSWGASGKIVEYRHPLNNYRMYRQADIEKLANVLRNPIPAVLHKRKPK